jgi:hypothetical protein
MGYTWMCLFLSLMEVVLSFVLIEKRFLVEVERGVGAFRTCSVVFV